MTIQHSAKIRTAVASAVALGLFGGAAAFAPSALASHGGGGVRAHGNCSATSTWKLKAKGDDGALEVEAEVDSNVVGQTWMWSIADNGTVAKSGKSTTKAPSGSFSVNRTIPNIAGTDAVAFDAKNKKTGETCSGSVSV